MKHLIASLKAGNWKTLLACFLYFDTGFTVWVMFGPLAPFISKQLSLTPAQSGFLVAVPVLAASIVRVTLGNLYQSVDGRRLALMGIALSAIPSCVLLLPIVPSYTLLLVLGGFLGVGGASFAIALPMAGSSYPPRVQGLVLGLAAAGNIGAVLDGFVFPGLAQRYGWQYATLAALPMLAIAAVTVVLWAEDRSAKSGSGTRAVAGFALSLVGIIGLVLLVSAGLLGHGNAGPLLLPVLGALLALAVLPRKYVAVLGERDTWVVMLVYSITFGGFVGMSSYVSLLLTTQYGLTKVDAGLVMAALSFTGAMVRPVGGLIADRLSGVRVLLVLLAMISLCNFAFAALMPHLLGGTALLGVLYLGFGLGNGATFQLVPHRWKGRTGVMTGIIGAAGGIGGFYLPVIMGIARESTGSYQMGFATFGILAALAFALVITLQQQWLAWAIPGGSELSMKILVVGNGMVGQRLLEQLQAASREPLEVTVLCEEPRAAYDRVHLTTFFSGKSAQDLSVVEPGFFETTGYQLHIAERAARIDRAARQVHSESGRVLDYDRLVLATGSYPFVPPIPGRDRPGCYVYRTIEDLEAIRDAGRQARRGVVIGGGLLGLEAAKALQDLGLDTQVVEFAPRLMAVQIDEPGGRVLRSRIAELGVGIHTGKSSVEITDGQAHAQRIRFADGTDLETDLIVFSAGIRPRDELARAAGLVVGERGGIAIDSACRTSDPDIFAIGECALWENRIFGLVAPGYQMAAVAAAQLLNRSDAKFEGADMSTKLKLMGVDVASIGDAHGVTSGARVCSLIDERRRVYKKLVISEDGQRLLGGILIGEAEDYGALLQMVHNGLPLPEHPEQLLLPPLAGSAQPLALGAAALPDHAQICSCNSVSKGDLCAAIASGATSIGALKKCTKAASSCGGCAPLVTQILKAELTRGGIAVDNHLCEHFPYSRQQLFHLIRVGELRSFEDLLARHGRGSGCDICKPTAASIFASCWNEFVLARERAVLQDSNDYYLANIQKDGTYSIVPRVAAGEITPRQLITLGEIAQKYRLYTKITGGQRIDLLGARVHQLPLIWRELVDAGFESGHAYGKSLRTVKSCVGSTWCRYGVQDSVGLALELEHRYKGLRSPHKIKFGVSGCTRECAEAQGKDVGVIATEKGWNLYVCGNGGMKPRHAELLAVDLDRPTLIRYVDRFLMFYIRTADRLQRTSVWRDNLEGGLDYLKEVIIEDSLGIGAELQADMQRVIGSYECEWKAAIQDPQTLKRFRHFVNSDRTDDNVVFVDERGQPRPAVRTESEALQQVV